MKYERFEDLPVWKAAIDFALRVFALTSDRAFNGAGDLRDQLQRSSLSISQNVAEGFERGSTNELLYYLYVARGSAGESRSALRFCDRYPPMAHLKPEIAALIDLALSISRRSRGWADSLQNSDIKGQRHLNDQSRQEYTQKRRTEQFLETLERIKRKGNAAPSDDSEI